MKSSRLFLGLGALAFSAQALAQGLPARAFTVVDSEPRFMVYVQHSFGATAQRSHGPRFGFSVDRQLPITLDSKRLRSDSVRLLDLQFSSSNPRDIWLNGFKLSGEPQYQYGYGSYGEDSWSNPWLWLGLGGAALLGISCATDNWPCEDDDDEEGYSPPDYEIPGS